MLKKHLHYAKTILSEKRGEMYIDFVIGLILFAFIIAFAINIFSVISVKTTADRVADELLETAAYYGGFGTEFQARVKELQKTTFAFTVEYNTSNCIDPAHTKVQVGDKISITIKAKANLAGFSLVLPIDIVVTRTGMSERYWKI